MRRYYARNLISGMQTTRRRAGPYRIYQPSERHNAGIQTKAYHERHDAVNGRPFLM